LTSSYILYFFFSLYVQDVENPELIFCLVCLVESTEIQRKDEVGAVQQWLL
jgi:hypothetical protein